MLWFSHSRSQCGVGKTAVERVWCISMWTWESPVGKRKKGAEDEILNLPKKAKLTIFMVWKNMRDNWR